MKYLVQHRSFGWYLCIGKKARDPLLPWTISPHREDAERFDSYEAGENARRDIEAFRDTYHTIEDLEDVPHGIDSRGCA